jgi:hypothetical protein
VRETLYTKGLARVALTSAARTNGTVNGTAVDSSVFGNDFRSVFFIVQTGTVTDGSHAVTLQDSADGSTGWANVDASTLQGSLPTITSADDDVLFQFGHLLQKQYVRLVVTTTGATTGGIFAASAVLFDASTEPVARS